MLTSESLLNKLLRTRLGEELQAEVQAEEESERVKLRAKLQQVEDARRAEARSFPGEESRASRKVQETRAAFEAAEHHLHEVVVNHMYRLSNLADRERELRSQLCE